MTSFTSRQLLLRGFSLGIPWTVLKLFAKNMCSHGGLNFWRITCSKLLGCYQCNTKRFDFVWYWLRLMQDPSDESNLTRMTLKLADNRLNIQCILSKVRLIKRSVILAWLRTIPYYQTDLEHCLPYFSWNKLQTNIYIASLLPLLLNACPKPSSLWVIKVSCCWWWAYHMAVHVWAVECHGTHGTIENSLFLYSGRFFVCTA